MQPFEEKESDQGCPNLNKQSVFTGPDKGLDLQVLFEGLKKQLYFPAVLIDFRDGGRTEGKMIGQKHDLTVLFNIQNNDFSQRVWAILSSLRSGEANFLVGPYIPSIRGGIKSSDLVVRVVLEAGDEKNPLANPPAKEGVIHIGPVYDDDGALIEGQVASYGHVMFFSRGHQDIGRHVIVMIQKDVGFHATFGPPERRPREKGQAKADDSGVQTEELVFKAKLALTCAENPLISKVLHRRPKYRFKQFGCSMPVGIGQGGFIGSLLDPEMSQFAQATGQPVANLPQGVGLGQVAEKHSRKLGPATEALGVPLGFVLMNQGFKGGPGKLSEQLTEQAGFLYHKDALLGCGLIVVLAILFYHTLWRALPFKLDTQLRIYFGQ